MYENTKANVFDVYLLKNTCEQRINYYVGRNFKENDFSEQFKADNRYSLLKKCAGHRRLPLRNYYRWANKQTEG